MRNFGKKIINPTITATKTDSSTAAAATSLVSLAKGWYSGEVKSMSISMAVFKASVINTKPIAKTKAIHSKLDTLK